MSFNPQPAIDAINALQQAYTTDMAGLTKQFNDTLADRDRQIAELKKTAGQSSRPKLITGFNASSKAQYDQQMAIFADDRPLAVRYYQRPGEAIGWPKEFGLRPQDEWIYSSKDRNPTMAKYLPMMQQAPTDGRKTIITPWHEPENDFTTPQARATYKSWFTQARMARDQVGNRDSLIACILMGYTWQPGSHRNPEDWIPDDADWDILLVDQYFAGMIGQSIATIPTAYDAIVATAKAHNKPWGAAETGIGKKVTGQVRDDAIELVGRTLAAKDASYGLWFQMDSPAEWQVDVNGANRFKKGLYGQAA